MITPPHHDVPSCAALTAGLISRVRHILPFAMGGVHGGVIAAEDPWMDQVRSSCTADYRGLSDWILRTGARAIRQPGRHVAPARGRIPEGESRSIASWRPAHRPRRS